MQFRLQTTAVAHFATKLRDPTRVECIIETCHCSNAFITQINHHQHSPSMRSTYTCTHTYTRTQTRTHRHTGFASDLRRRLEFFVSSFSAQPAQLCMGHTRILRQNVFISVPGWLSFKAYPPRDRLHKNEMCMRACACPSAHLFYVHTSMRRESVRGRESFPTAFWLRA